MDEALLTAIAAQTLTVTLKLALPTLAVSLGIGLVVSLLQAVTQIQEQTLTFIPKVVAMAVVIVIAGPWMLGEIVTYTQNLYQSIPSMIG